MNKTLKILQEARALVAKQWCQEDMAQNAALVPRRPDPDDDTICAWCALGAMHQAGLKHGVLHYDSIASDEAFDLLHRDNSVRDAEQLLVQALRAQADKAGLNYEDDLNWYGENSIVRWNDHAGRTQEEVVAAFDKAVALAEDAEKTIEDKGEETHGLRTVDTRHKR